MLFSQPKTTSVHGISPAQVRPVLAKRLSRVRFAWFLIGALAGVALSYYLFHLLHRDAEYGSRLNKEHAVALLDNKLAPLPPLALNVTEAPAISQPVVVAAAQLPVKPAMTLPADFTIKAGRSDTLASLLTQKGVPADEAIAAVQNMKRVYKSHESLAGHSVELHLDKSKNDPSLPAIKSLSLFVSPLKTVTLSRAKDDSFNVKESTSPVIKGFGRAGGEIHSSLYQTAVDSGLPASMMGEIIQAFSYDVDFQRDIREGDSIDVVFERMHSDKNVTVGYGKVLYASLKLGDDEYTIYRHVTADGFAGYYNAKGDSVKKALLKTPINGARITSGFGMRMHPLLGYSKMHKGIDFGAAIGTPIYAAGDGVIEEAGRKGGYGNYVKVKHNANYATAYGHASRIAHGIRPGVHVSQGQVIAYVGSTGFSTGPHLHYEIIQNGAPVNPSGVKFRTGQLLTGREMMDFKKQVKQVQTALNTLPRSNRQLAMLETK